MKIVVIHSGGMDSSTLLASLVSKHGAENILALSFDYGQRHRIELTRAAEFCANIGVEREVIPISPDVFKNSALSADQTIDVPKGHYEDDNMKLTFVANRNMILLSIAAGVAISRGYRSLYYGAHSGDFTVYPDCRKEFVEAVETCVNVGNYEENSLFVNAPYLNIKKADILQIGFDLGVDYGLTWTCYSPVDTDKACGKCGACQERLEAFAQMGKVDPVEYV